MTHIGSQYNCLGPTTLILNCNSSIDLFIGLFRGDLGLKLQHVCDSAIILGEVSDDSEIHRIVPDAKRYVHTEQT